MHRRQPRNNMPSYLRAIHTVPNCQKTSGSTRQTPSTTICPRCGGSLHKGGRQICPARGVGCRKVGLVCRSLRQHLPPPTSPYNTSPETRAVTATSFMASTKLHLLSSFRPAPTIAVHVASLNGEATIQVLPDSGADI